MRLWGGGEKKEGEKKPQIQKLTMGKEVEPSQTKKPKVPKVIQPSGQKGTKISKKEIPKAIKPKKPQQKKSKVDVKKNKTQQQKEFSQSWEQRFQLIRAPLQPQSWKPGYGLPEMMKIEKGADFIALLDELVLSDSELVTNRQTILQSFLDGKLFGLCVPHSAEQYFNKTDKDGIFCQSGATWNLLPCFCIAGYIADGPENADIADLLWVHPRARLIGLGKTLVTSLGIKRARKGDVASEGFWTKCSIPLI